MTNRTYRVHYDTYGAHYIRTRHTRHFAARLTAGLFTRILDAGIRAGIVGGWMVVEIVH